MLIKQLKLFVAAVIITTCCISCDDDNNSVVTEEESTPEPTPVCECVYHEGRTGPKLICICKDS